MLLREGLSRLLADAGFVVVAQAGDADDLRRKVAAHRPDVAIVDVQMPPDHTDDGLRAALEIRARRIQDLCCPSFALDEACAPHLDLIPGENTPRCGLPAQGQGGRRRLLRRRGASRGGGRVGARSRDRGADGGPAPQAWSRWRRADPRRRRVLALMAEGKSNRGIAASLGVTLAAVEKHVGRIFAKLGLADEPLEHRRVLGDAFRLRAADGRAPPRSVGSGQLRACTRRRRHDQAPADRGHAIGQAGQARPAMPHEGPARCRRGIAVGDLANSSPRAGGQAPARSAPSPRRPARAWRHWPAPRRRRSRRCSL